MMVDGNVALPTPVTPLKNECDFIIAINITRGMEDQPEPSNIVEIYSRVRDVSVAHLNSFLLNEADFVIKPKHDNLHWSAFDKTDKFIEAGEFAAENVINDLLEELENIEKKPKEAPKETFWTRIKKRLFS